MAPKHNGKATTGTVRYRKTEHAYQVEVIADFHPDGTSTFGEFDSWDIRPYEFVPCCLELEFAKSLLGKPRGVRLPHLDLDDAVNGDAAVKLMNETPPIAAGMWLLQLGLNHLSLNSLNGDHLLERIASAVQMGRQLADDKRAHAADATQDGDVNARIEHWLRDVVRLVGVVRGKGDSSQGERGSIPSFTVSLGKDARRYKERLANH